MTQKQIDLYKCHVANLRELQLALSHVARLARVEIASGDPQQSLRSLLRLYSFLVGAWAECRLSKLLHEQHGFDSTVRATIISSQTQLERWQRTIELAFRKRYGITHAELDENTIGVAPFARLQALHAALDDELRVIIEVRNKLAHGQWVYPLNNEETSVEPDKYQRINKEDLQSLQFKYALIGHLADLMHDLVVSHETFERDFESHFRRLRQARINLETRSYEDYAKRLIERRRIARVTSREKEEWSEGVKS